MSDQAAGLRAYASQRRDKASLVTIGHPSPQAVTAICERLASLSGQAWETLPLAVGEVNAAQRTSPHWGIWVASGAEGLQRAYRELKRWSQHERLPPLLVIRDPVGSGDMPLDNLVETARRFLAIELVVDPAEWLAKTRPTSERR
ncbi:hypothetical protein C8E00_103192 [Chromohalobacter marismortui]|uniref:DUF2868 domain-containing protein n=1 Tax=Chromohalobacter marismortui TaxID=42055 RepID=A0A4R7NR20_9GAMM|nr:MULTISPECIES: hypothetical protein [Chromohalobacter]MCI0508800.1 hypothetical protein [Chromohalobacter sp.]MCI0592002.1 hypothetical protein [Chromohalobacter sp.]TDU22830.1 hypothetical protein C8E00_103192 [Chromohalobacter marismortui]